MKWVYRRHIILALSLIKTFTKCRILQVRDTSQGAIRMRSRSTSSGVGAEGSGIGAGGPVNAPRRPPPLNTVASEPTLPQASVMLAQLLSAQHCQWIICSFPNCNSGSHSVRCGCRPTKGEYLTRTFHCSSELVQAEQHWW